jgi:hypothetical protein
VSEHALWLLWGIVTLLLWKRSLRATSDSYLWKYCVKATGESNLCKQPVKAIRESCPLLQAVKAICESYVWKQVVEATYSSKTCLQFVKVDCETSYKWEQIVKAICESDMWRHWVKAICESDLWKLAVNARYRRKHLVGHLPHKVAASVSVCGLTFQTASYFKHTHMRYPVTIPVLASVLAPSPNGALLQKAPSVGAVEQEHLFFDRWSLPCVTYASFETPTKRANAACSS